MKRIYGLFLVLFVFVLSPMSKADVAEAIKTLPVQDAGRLKPFDTFARESLHLVYGKKSYQGRSATDVVLTWMLIPDHWDKEPFVEIRHSGLREALQLAPTRSYFSPQELFVNDRLGLLFQDLQNQREADEKLNPYYQAVQRLNNQMTIYHMIKQGSGVRVVPPKEGDTWVSVVELNEELGKAFSAVTRAFVASVGSQQKENPQQAVPVEKAVAEFRELARQQAPDKYADMTRMRLEVHYNEFHPFMWAWVMYLIAALFFVAHIISQRKALYGSGWLFLLAGFLLHTYGMVVRSYLTGRPPVSNMYETVVWVPWGTVLFAMILERLQKIKVLLPAACVVSVLCLILTDLAPTVLDGTLQPLEPVLRSTFWLTTHVLIITISYAAFFLAFALGDLVLFYYLRDEKKYAKQIFNGVRSIYRSIQIGVVLLAAGIILGGIWADYSWGRFWGWDPKETWALIALLGYVALLHGRLVGWVKSFAMAAGSIIAFSLVIMAWYGVNFVLGAGLHSYGFGAGGVEYVSAFVAVHLLYVAYVATVRHSRQKANLSDS